MAEQKGPLREKLATVRAQADTFAKAENTRATIDNMEREAASLREASEGATQAITQLEEYKAELLSDLPLEGIEVRDGEIFSGGVPFDNLNEARQVEIAVELAKLRAGALGVVCVDGLEKLSQRTYDEFRRQVMEADLQLFVTRVQDGEFNVSTAH